MLRGKRRLIGRQCRRHGQDQVAKGCHMTGRGRVARRCGLILDPTATPPERHVFRRVRQRRRRRAGHGLLLLAVAEGREAGVLRSHAQWRPSSLCPSNSTPPPTSEQV